MGRALRLTIALSAAGTLLRAQSPAVRTMVPEDLTRIRPIWQSELSPDGRNIALSVGRDPRIRSRYMGRSDVTQLQRDIWIAPTGGGTPINVTQGDVDPGTNWVLSWSPSGRRLAMLSTQGREDRIRIFVWTTGTPRAVPVTDSTVYHETQGRRFDESATTPVVWLNDDELLYVAVAAGFDQTTMDAAPAAWARTREGKSASSSVLESGAARRRDTPVWSTLQRVHVATRRSVALARIPPAFQRNTTLAISLAPGGARVAIVGDIGPNAVPPQVPIDATNERKRRIGIVSTSPRPDSVRVIEWAAMIAAPNTASMQWSPDGQRLVVIGRRRERADSLSDPVGRPATLFLLDTNVAWRHVSDSLLAAGVEWASNNELLVRGRLADVSARSSRSRDDWWRLPIEAGSRSEAVSDSLRTVPSALVRLSDGRWAGVSDTTLVVLDADGPFRTIRITGGTTLRSVAWPRQGKVATANTLVVQMGGRTASAQAPYRLDIVSETATASVVDRPAGARFVGARPVDADSMIVAFQGATDSATVVWGGGARSLRVAFRNNEQMASVRAGERRMISYRSADGDSLNAALLLPYGYRTGERVPLVVWVYGGQTQTDTVAIQGKYSIALFNEQLFASKGFAVLFPSTPLGAQGTTDAEPIDELVKTVLPAVDRLVDLGIADRDRLVVAGLSYGAYAVYGLLTRTSRFKAGIAIDGDADLFTSYTALDGAHRYSDAVHETGEGYYWSEASQGRMGTTPWKDPQRYLRNSPFFSLDRIRTPLLIIHGDLDFVPIAHAEQMFLGLNRLGKTARFVRYFGERHGPYAPANLMDAWKHIYGWLDEYAPPAAAGSKASGK